MRKGSKCSEKQKEVWSRPEVKKRKSESTRESWKDPEVKRKHLEALNKPEVKEKISRASRNAWKDPDYREKVLESRNTSEVRKKRSEAAKKQCLNGHAVYMNSCIKNPSKLELRLREIVKELFPTSISQYKVLNYALDNAILESKIVIEFDGWYHFDCQHDIDYHKKRQQEIENEGWKFLRYNIFQKFPTKDQVREDIQKVIV
jgi:very-short-patch-repair endonuclease